MINNLIKTVNERRPLIHCITNPISINQCANAILAVGASPIMAEHPDEVAEITETADALLLNLGNITDARIKSAQIAAGVARKKELPFVVDAVGAACSMLRRKLALKMIKKNRPTVIKGNYSEICALHNPNYSSAGVDAENLGDISTVVTKLAEKYDAVILASGKVDMITDGKRIIYMENGSSQLAKVTGTGCMLGALCATYLSVSGGMEAATAACAVLGICGELAETDKGNGSFTVNLMDRLSALTDVEKYLKMEEESVGKI